MRSKNPPVGFLTNTNADVEVSFPKTSKPSIPSKATSTLPDNWTEELGNLSKFPELPFDWDGFGAFAVSVEVVKEADKILRFIYNRAFDTYKRPLRAPEIDPIPNDGVYIQFKQGDTILLLGIKRNNQTNEIEKGYFGKKSPNTIKGNLSAETLPSIIDFLANFTD